MSETIPHLEGAAALEELHLHQIELEMQSEELQRALIELENSRERYFNIYEQAPVGYVTVNEHALILEMNRRAADLLAMPREVLLGRALWRSICKEDQETFYESRQKLQNGQRQDMCEVRLERPEALPFWARLEMSNGEEGGRAVCRVVIVDIHDHKMAEKRLEAAVFEQGVAYQQLQRKDRELQHTLEERESLLQELHHRVKNNLQVVSSLLRLQAEKLTDADTQAALTESYRRVRCMAMIHERLDGQNEVDRIDFEEYTDTLLQELFESYGAISGHVTRRMNVSPVSLKIDQAIPCSLILNELVTNALKYAYPSGQGGELRVTLEQTGDGFVQLTVCDDGVGLPAGLALAHSESMGLPIVEMLARQIGGTVQLGDGPGAWFTVKFHKEE